MKARHVVTNLFVTVVTNKFVCPALEHLMKGENEGSEIARWRNKPRDRRPSKKFDAGQAFFASHRSCVPAHAHERRPHADGRHSHVALVDRFRLHDLSVLSLPARDGRGDAIAPKRS